MSFNQPDFIPDLFLPENIECSFQPSTFSDNLNDLFSDLSQKSQKKDIKFILTKEVNPHSFLKKKNKFKNRKRGFGLRQFERGTLE